MSDIVEFLTARYEDRERAARQALSDPRSATTGTGVRIVDGELAMMPSAMSDSLALHFVTLSPKAVLADIAAKRKRLALYVETKEQLAQALKDAPWKDDPAFAHSYARERININKLTGEYGAYLMSVRLDAAPYAEHPDFDPAWRIDG